MLKMIVYKICKNGEHRVGCRHKLKKSKGKVIMIAKLGKHKGKFLIGSKGK